SCTTPSPTRATWTTSGAGWSAHEDERAEARRALAPRHRSDAARVSGAPERSAVITEELRFERLERLGAGGMAIVWRALDRKLRREVALKELRDEIAFSSEGLARFRHEAEAIARL